MPQINNAGLQLIENFEGCELTAYQDSVGVWTIGYGHTGDVTPGQTIDQNEADYLLEQDLARFEKCVNDQVNRDLTPNQFAAMVSLCYNVGCYGCPMMFQLINAGEFSLAQQHFGAYVYAGGRVLEGLVRRRAAEAQLFGTIG